MPGKAPLHKYSFPFHSVTNHYIQFVFQRFLRKQNPAFRKVLVTSWAARRMITWTDGQTSRFVRCQKMPHFINTLLYSIINTLLHSIINTLSHSIINTLIFHYKYSFTFHHKYSFTFHYKSLYVQFLFSMFLQKWNPASRKGLVTSWTTRRKTIRTDGQTRRSVRCQTMPHFTDTLLHAIINTLLYSIANTFLYSIYKYSFTFHYKQSYIPL